MLVLDGEQNIIELPSKKQYMGNGGLAYNRCDVYATRRAAGQEAFRLVESVLRVRLK